MALTDFYIKEGDTAPAIVIVCEDDTGTPITNDLTGATVEFHMKDATGTVIIAAGVGSVIDNTAKTVGYQWVVGDTDTPDLSTTAPHQAEFQVTFSNGLITTFPNNSNINVHVFPQIA